MANNNKENDLSAEELIRRLKGELFGFDDEDAASEEVKPEDVGTVLDDSELGKYLRENAAEDEYYDDDAADADDTDEVDILSLLNDIGMAETTPAPAAKEAPLSIEEYSFEDEMSEAPEAEDAPAEAAKEETAPTPAEDDNMKIALPGGIEEVFPEPEKIEAAETEASLPEADDAPAEEDAEPGAVLFPDEELYPGEDLFADEASDDTSMKFFDGDRSGFEIGEDEELPQAIFDDDDVKTKRADLPGAGDEITAEDLSFLSDDILSDTSYKDIASELGDGVYNNTELDIMEGLSEAPEEAADGGSEKDIAEEISELIGAQEKEKPKKDETSEAKAPAAETDEYTAPQQAKRILNHYKKQYNRVIPKLIFSVFLTVVLFIYENVTTFGGTMPYAFSPVYNPRVYILIGLQLFLLIAALSFEEVGEALKSLKEKKIVPQLLIGVISVMAVAYSVALCFVYPRAEAFRLFLTPCAVGVVITLFYKFLTIKREVLAFKIASSKKIKYVISEYTPASDDRAVSEFYSRFPEPPKMLKINKTAFVSDFMKNMHKKSGSKSLISVLIPVSVVGAAALFAVSYLGVHDAFTAVTSAFIAFLALSPVSVLISYILPHYRAAKETYGIDGAIIGETASRDFTPASVISFEDKDVFPPYSVRIQSIRVYGESRIDHVLFAATSVFKKLGGPLYDVFENASADLTKSDNVEVIRVSEDGIEATVDGEQILLGSAAFMENSNFIPVYTADDEAAESRNELRIMYMAANGEISAKLYIQYTVDTDFELILKQLTGVGHCIAIKTFDPNIDNALLGHKIKIKKYPVKILKCSSPDELSETVQSREATIVSRAGTKSLLQTLAVCDRLESASKTTAVVSVLSVIIGLVIMCFAGLTDTGNILTSFYVVIYQLFWIIAAAIITHFYI